MTRDPLTMTDDVWSDPRVRALDLFAGAGGWDLAAQTLGIHADGVENMPEARATRDAAGLATVHDDVWTFPPLLLALYVALICSPPCQTFSTAGKGSGRKALEDVLAVLPSVATSSLDELRAQGERFGDDRTALVLTPLWFALNMPNVRWAAWEQVPAVLPVWEACAAVLRAHGWHVWTGILNAEQHGVPQTRRRAFLIASRDHAVHAPTPTHSRFYSHDPARLDRGVLPWVSMADGIGWGMVARPSYTVNGGGSKASHSGHEWGGASVRKALLELHDSEDPAVWRPRDLVGFARRYDGQGDAVTLDGVQYRARDLRPASFPAQVVTEKARSWERFPEGATSRNDAIRVSVAEAGLLQTFPVDHPWQGANTKRYLQAGNAVPPLLGRAVLEVASGIEQAARPALEVVTSSTAPRFADVDDLDLFAS